MLASSLHDPFDAALGMAGSLDGMMRLARELVAAQRHVDLSGLNNEIGLLCARALDLPPEAGKRLRPELETLLQTLDGLTEALRESHAGAAASHDALGPDDDEADAPE